jgi:hypothetical protein
MTILVIKLILMVVLSNTVATRLRGYEATRR